ncbi:unnamed protein product [Peniophora sp. CBMAI 1063]|nr:unnamed protein product [Peniophora sp. CBMAI 1063]
MLSSWMPSSLGRRRGGGGHGGGGHGGSHGGGSHGVGESSGAKGSVSGGVHGPVRQIPTPNLPSGKSSSSTYGNGGGEMVKAGSGPFKGELLGGGTRTEVYGTSVYGSGYPTRYHGSGLPYYYYPVVWGTVWGTGPVPYPTYLNRTEEYGQPTNNSRPGGPLMQVTLRSNTTDSTFHFLADNSTVYSLLPIIRANCSAHGNLDNATSSSVPFVYVGNPGNASDPLPTDAVQYYRASSAVLTLEGYNNTIVLSSTPNGTAKSIPSGVDSTLLACLNVTIGFAIPLVDSSGAKKSHLPAGAIVGIVIGSLALLLICYVCCCRCGGDGQRVQRSRTSRYQSVPPGHESYSMAARPAQARSDRWSEEAMNAPRTPSSPIQFPQQIKSFDGERAGFSRYTR